MNKSKFSVYAILFVLLAAVGGFYWWVYPTHESSLRKQLDAELARWTATGASVHPDRIVIHDDGSHYLAKFDLDITSILRRRATLEADKIEVLLDKGRVETNTFQKGALPPSNVFDLVLPAQGYFMWQPDWILGFPADTRWIPRLGDLRADTNSFHKAERLFMSRQDLKTPDLALEILTCDQLLIFDRMSYSHAFDDSDESYLLLTLSLATHSMRTKNDEAFVHAMDTASNLLSSDNLVDSAEIESELEHLAHLRRVSFSQAIDAFFGQATEE
jgi:hypothetical protein